MIEVPFWLFATLVLLFIVAVCTIVAMFYRNEALEENISYWRNEFYRAQKYKANDYRFPKGYPRAGEYCTKEQYSEAILSMMKVDKTV